MAHLSSRVYDDKTVPDAHVKKEMNATWFSHGAIRYNPEIGLPEYHIVSLEHDYCNGDFSCLLGKINLKRAIGFHLVQSYIPTALIVAISWVSFWIDRRAVPARVSLSFTTLLTLSTQGNGIRYALPPVSYAKAIDYFYGGKENIGSDCIGENHILHLCMLFIFGVLLEFAMVNSYMRRANKLNNMAEKLQYNYGRKKIFGMFNAPSEFDSDCEGSPLSINHCDNIDKKSASFLCKSLQYSRRALTIDKASRFVFPSVFTLFNIVYWVYYIHERGADINHR
ncbi:Neurotransmitter-gated ion-channel transmembrane region [Dictyocaulus viviparus]|uniref:Neurotransmitter-gated ion-channel transmembrane region n=1 Tax=Dictyocaulus viviparus TaxID=29172 RepID=A0A0D8Y468_DICVI|nr:Neurotransmitter-gated ion-channel transmembrane region [Dictyocaulus viviparus]